MQMNGVRKPCQAHACRKSAQGEDDSTQERGLPQSKWVRAGKHHTLTVFAPNCAPSANWSAGVHLPGPMVACNLHRGWKWKFDSAHFGAGNGQERESRL
jgi:hypothetical protein